MSPCSAIPTPSLRRALVGLGAAVLAVGVSACQPEQPSEVPSAPPATATAEPTPEITGPADGVELTIPDDMDLSAEEMEAVEGAHASYVAVLNYENAVLSGDRRLADRAEEFARGAYLGVAEKTFATYEAEDRVRTGSIKYSAIGLSTIEWIESDETPEVYLNLCIDLTDLKIINAEGESILEDERPDELYREILFTSEDKKWLPTESVVDREDCDSAGVVG